MNKTGTAVIKLLATVGLLAVSAAAFLFGGTRLPAVLLLIAALAALCWLWFIRGKRPEGELPSSTVSCCHYLGDNEGESSGGPQEKNV
ncbi:MAG: hypothetical protein JRC87_02465 [Deltaproteobacteria bacterium]|nr:hypothetical protein [Deltaproteobacteria bacterium]MBW2658450.1 hypothetical protein [Deltaproteobacteria bacterium]